MVDLQRHSLADAPDEGVYLVSPLITDVLSQALANEPDLTWGKGRFTPLFPDILDLLPAYIPRAVDEGRQLPISAESG